MYANDAAPLTTDDINRINGKAIAGDIARQSCETIDSAFEIDDDGPSAYLTDETLDEMSNATPLMYVDLIRNRADAAAFIAQHHLNETSTALFIAGQMLDVETRARAIEVPTATRLAQLSLILMVSASADSDYLRDSQDGDMMNAEKVLA
jgi:hypothetical protein